MPITPLPPLDRASASFRTDVNTFLGSQIQAFATEANALAAELNANLQASAKSISGTSATSLTVGTGAMSLTTQADLAFVPGMELQIVSTVIPTNWMVATVTSYDIGTGALAFTATAKQGSGTFAAWTIALDTKTIAPFLPPTGAVVQSASPTLTGHLPCDGASYSVAAYPNLAATYLDNPRAGFYSRNSGGYYFSAFAYGNGVYVAGANSGKLYRSTDGVSWSLATTNPLGSVQVSGVAFGNGLFVAVSQDSGAMSLVTSPDGVTWTTRGVSSVYFYGVIYANGLFVAYGMNGACRTSPDGITWTVRDAKFLSGHILKVRYLNGLFIAVGGGVTSGASVATSPDGLTWTARYLDTAAGNFTDVAYGGGAYVAACSTLSKSARSTDGVTWAALAGLTLTGNVAYGAGRFVSVQGVSGTIPAKVLGSTDGLTWTTIGALPSSVKMVAASSEFLTYENGLFAASRYQSTQDGGLAFSTDGISWSAAALSQDTALALAQVRLAAFVNGRWLLSSEQVGSGAPYLISSPLVAADTAFSVPRIAANPLPYFVKV